MLQDLSWLDALQDHIESPSTRRQEIETLARRMARELREALGLEGQERQEERSVGELMEPDEERLAKMARDRANRIKRERCAIIHHACVLARAAVNEALGRLTIDDTTAGTGLTDEERLLVMQVSGRGL